MSQSRTRRTLTAGGRTLRALGLDGPLTGVLALIVSIGILVVYSASGQNVKMVEHHLGNIAIAIAALLVLAKTPRVPSTCGCSHRPPTWSASCCSPSSP